MFATNPMIYAMLFSASIVLTYMTVRNGWLRLPVAMVAGVIYTSFGFFLFALARGTGLVQAIIVGLALGTVFTFVSGIVAAIFRTQALESGREVVRRAGRTNPVAEK